MSGQSDIEQLLRSLTGVGQLNSQGEFTLDPSRAERLLERYQLPTPAYFMLHAVGAALSSGATHLKATLRRDLFELVFDGELFSSQDASECVASLWQSSEHPEVLRLQELAIARGGALQWGAQEFLLENLGQGLQRLRVPRLGWMNRLTGRFLKSEEIAIFSDHLVPTPQCQIELNGKKLSEMSLPSTLQHAFVVGESSLPLLGHFPPGTATTVLDPEELSESQGVICYLPKSRGERSPRCFWPGFMDVVLNGRLYRCPMPPGWNNWWGVFYLRHLQRDLSFSYLAEPSLERLRSFFYRAREISKAL